MPDKVILISGPAGAGKSAVARQWASTRNGACSHLPLDDFRELVKAGYHDPRIGWNAEAQRQLDLARSNVSNVANNFLRAGVEVVIDDVVFPDWEPSGFAGWQNALGTTEIDFVVLFPGWEVVRDRNSNRN